MIDLTGSPPFSSLVQTVPTDPGRAWVKDAAAALDAAPDRELDPLPEARWPSEAVRTGVYGSVTPRVVALPGGGYRMYYTQILPRPGFPAGANDYENATTRILSAASADGFLWIAEPGVRLSARQGGAGQFRVVSAEVVPTAGGPGQLRMYYECCGSGPHSEANSIRSATSKDGLEWTPEPGARFGASGRNYAAPRIQLLEGGACRLFCCERGRGIISAYSDDGGLSFREEAGVRIAPGGTYDAQTAFAPEILRVSQAGWVMYYAAYSAPNRAQILRATSDDGLTWRKEPEPAVAPGGRWDAVKCSEMCLFRLAQSQKGEPRYRILYEACDGTAADARGVWRIAGATSSP